MDWFSCCKDHASQIDNSNHKILMFKKDHINNKVEKLQGTASKEQRDSVHQDNVHQSNIYFKTVQKSHKYQELLKKYQGTNKMWQDQDFSLKQQTYYNVNDDEKKVVWKRASEVIKNVGFFPEKVSADDVIQGDVGDCYVLSAMAGLAERQERIRNIFQSTEINPNGFYMARIMHKGVYQEVVVDDYFPVLVKNNKWACVAPASGRFIWPMVLEKCWAKLYGSYQIIEGGFSNEVLHGFSAAPTIHYDYDKEKAQKSHFQHLWKILSEANKKGYVICCGTKQDKKNTFYKNTGIARGHAYTVLGVYESPQRIIKIRNPWGKSTDEHDEWTGRASDNDKDFWDSVSVNDKKVLGYKNERDGTFFMLWEDCLKMFVRVDICEIQDENHYMYLEGKFKRDEPTFYEIESLGGKVTLTISQANTRGLYQQGLEPDYASVTMILSSSPNNKNGWNNKSVKDRKDEEYTFITGQTKNYECDSYLQIQDLPKGKYLLCIAINSSQANIVDATLNTYSKNSCLIRQAFNVDSQTFLHKSFADHAMKNIQNQTPLISNVQGIWQCHQFFEDSSYGYSVVHVNKNAKIKIFGTISGQQCKKQNIILRPPYSNNKDNPIECMPGHNVIVLWKGKDSITFPPIFHLKAQDL